MLLGTWHTITKGAWAIVRLNPDCPGNGRRPHHPAEDACRVRVAAGEQPGDHEVFARYEGGGQDGGPLPPGGLRLGRYLRPDELEPCDLP